MKKVIAIAAIAAATVGGAATVMAGGPHGKHGDNAMERADYETRASRWFERLDSNGDGVISLQESEERAKRHAERRAAKFTEADANGDGQVSLEEFRAKASARFDKLDADGDGKVTPEERRAAREARHGSKQN